MKAFRDGQVVDEFTGAIPPAQIEQFVARVVPSPADRLAAADDEESLRKALELDPRNAVAARKLGRLLLQRGDASEALEAARRRSGRLRGRGPCGAGPPGGGDRRRRAQRSPRALERGFSAWDAGDHERALESLQEAIAETDDPERRDLVRRVMVAIFTELGADHPLAREHRRRLAAALN